MSVLWTSFNKAADNGKPWFVFDDAGRTVAKDFKTRGLAARWAWEQMFPLRVARRD